MLYFPRRTNWDALDLTCMCFAQDVKGIVRIQEEDTMWTKRPVSDVSSKSNHQKNTKAVRRVTVFLIRSIPMKTKIMLDVRTISVAVLFISLGLLDIGASGTPATSEYEAVEANRIPQILNMISTQVRNNYERIKTWQGKVDATIDYIYEGPVAAKVFQEETDSTGETPKLIRHHIESIIEFAVDVEQDFLYVSHYCEKPFRYEDLETGRNLGAKGIPNSSRTILRPDYYLRCSPNTTIEGVVINRRAVKETRKKEPGRVTCDDPHVYDPRESFGLPLQPVWVTFPRMIRLINERGEYGRDGYVLKVEERTRANITEYRIQKPGKVGSDLYLFHTSIFSSEKGFNVVSQELTDANDMLITRSTWDYELVNGVYVPNKRIKQNFERTSGILTLESRSTFEGIQINHSIPLDTFTYKSLGLENSDVLVDKILAKEYILQDGMLVEVEQSKK